MNPHLNAKHCLFVLLLLGGDTPQHGFVGYSSIFPLDQPETPPRSPSCRLIAGRFAFQEISSCSSLRPNMSPINLKGLRGQINKLFKNRIPPLKGIKQDLLLELLAEPCAISWNADSAPQPLRPSETVSEQSQQDLEI